LRGYGAGEALSPHFCPRMTLLTVGRLTPASRAPLPASPSGLPAGPR